MINFIKNCFNLIYIGFKNVKNVLVTPFRFLFSWFNLLSFFKRLYDLFIKVSAWFLIIRLISIPIFFAVYFSGKFRLEGYSMDDTKNVFYIVIFLILLSFLKEVLDIFFGPELSDRFWIPIYIIRFFASFAIGTFLLFIPKLIFCYYHWMDYVTLGLGFALVIEWTKEDYYRRIVDILEIRGFKPSIVPPDARDRIVNNSKSMSELEHNLIDFIANTSTPFQKPSMFGLIEYFRDHPAHFFLWTFAIGATLAGTSYIFHRMNTAMNMKKSAVIYYTLDSKDIDLGPSFDSSTVSSFVDPSNSQDGCSVSGPAITSFVESWFPPHINNNFFNIDYSRITVFPGSTRVTVYTRHCTREIVVSMPNGGRGYPDPLEHEPLLVASRSRRGDITDNIIGSVVRVDVSPSNVYSNSFFYAFFNDENGQTNVIFRVPVDRFFLSGIRRSNLSYIVNLDSMNSNFRELFLEELFPNPGYTDLASPEHIPDDFLEPSVFIPSDNPVNNMIAYHDVSGSFPEIVPDSVIPAFNISSARRLDGVVYPTDPIISNAIKNQVKVPFDSIARPSSAIDSSFTIKDILKDIF